MNSRRRSVGVRTKRTAVARRAVNRRNVRMRSPSGLEPVQERRGLRLTAVSFAYYTSFPSASRTQEEEGKKFLRSKASPLSIGQALLTPCAPGGTYSGRT